MNVKMSEVYLKTRETPKRLLLFQNELVRSLTLMKISHYSSCLLLLLNFYTSWCKDFSGEPLLQLLGCTWSSFI